MSDPKQAREALAARLREFRIAARRSGKGLAESLSWPPSKVSKIELARQTPTEADIEAWLKETGAEDQGAEVLASLRTLELQYAEWRRQMEAGTRIRQQRIKEIESETRLLRVFESVFVPGLLQTPEYARRMLAESIDLHETPPDLDLGVATRMARQAILYESHRRFHFVLTEAVLRYRLGPPELMAGQLDRLMALTGSPNIHLGVIPFDAVYPAKPTHGFWLHDERVVLVETIGAELTLTQPHEISLYTKVFARLASAAVYGRKARALIGKIAEAP